MLFLRLDTRLSRLIRLAGLGLVIWTVASASSHPAGTSGRGLVVTILLAVASAAWLWWVRTGDVDRPVSADLYVLAIAGGILLGASPASAAAAYAFVAVVAAAVRAPLARAWTVLAAASLALAVTVLVWDGTSLGLLSYVLGFASATLAASNVRQFRARAEQAEVLLAQTQRSQEERLRAATLEESTRLAREIHDVLAHALAGLTIQLEATTALIEGGAEGEQVLARVRRAHALAREGLRETRRAVGALRGETVAVAEAVAALAAEYRSAADAPATLDLRGDRTRLTGELGQTVLRAVQEGLTNVAKHAPGAEVAVSVEVGSAEVVVVVEDRLAGVPVPAAGGGLAHAGGDLAHTGGGYGLQGMRERARALGGTLQAGPTDAGWRVSLTLPAEPTR